MPAPGTSGTLAAMHTCLSLADITGHWYVEDAVFELLARLEAYCDSIDSCTLAVAGPTGAGEARSWRVDLKLRIFDETVRATIRLPEGADPKQSLTRVLGEIYARATAQMARIAKQHQGCNCHRAERLAAASKAFA
jgi:hypothetical protein